MASPEVTAKLKAVTDGINARLAALELSDEQIMTIADALYKGYRDYAAEHELPDPQLMLRSFAEYIGTPEVKKQLTDTVSKAVNTEGLEKAAGEMIQGVSTAIEQQLASVMAGLTEGLSQQLGEVMKTAMEAVAGQLQDSLQKAFSFDSDGLKNAFSAGMTANEMKDLFNSLLSGYTNVTLKGVLAKLGYASVDEPYSITIYPADFESKARIKASIEGYNQAQKDAGNDDKVVVYTDMVDALMSSVTQIIDAISVILIAFVAISLVVSSVMIGVITYISVLERKKEIGILRAIGASKRNISNVFNAETFIIGALAGVLGVGLTLLMLVPANAIIHAVTEQQDINAVLPPAAAVILIVLSIALTLIGGIIHSRKAAHSDPVSALRSE